MILARAPFRICLGGWGTDLPSYYSRYGGFAVSIALNKYLYIYVNRPAADDFIRVKYSRYEQVASPDEIQHDLVRPSLKMLGLNGSLEIVSMADIPANTGLGSSSTYLVALLTALHELKREKVPTQALAEQACHIEIDLAGHPVGKHDHYLAAFGGMTCLDIQPDGRVKVSPLGISITTVEEFRNSVLLFYTGLTCLSSHILKELEQAIKLDPITPIDSLHRTKEMGYRIREVLEKGDLEGFGLLLDEHWQNEKLRTGEMNDPDIERWYRIAKDNGALGGKLMGAGAGGFFLFYCPNSNKAQLRQALAAAGLREVPYDFDFEGAKVVVNF